MNSYRENNYFNPIFYPFTKPENRINKFTYYKNYLIRDITEVILEYGSNGVEVEKLQSDLIELGYLIGKPDGYFGRNTERAVLNFQRDAYLVMDGVVGPDTWTLLEKVKTEALPVKEPMVKKGDQNLFVMNLQVRLKDLGYLQEEPDGIFGDGTEEALKSFQRDQGLNDDGIAGPDTWRAIKKAHATIDSPKPRIINPMLEGTTGEEVSRLQNNLKNLGYYNGDITGTFDVATGTAVQAFQRDNNMLPTGIVNQKTWELIEEKLSSRSDVDDFIRQQKRVLERPTIRLGDSGEDVGDLQNYLKQLSYYNGPIDNNFDSETNKAVRAFQNNNKLTVDGIVGRNTWSALVNLYSPLAICDPSISERVVGVVVDAGHGGDDPGAVSGNIVEKNLNLKIAQYIAKRLTDLGIPNSLIRNSDETLSNTERIRRMKTPFGDVSNAIVLSNHINSGGGEGAEVIYALRNESTLARSILTEIGNTGQKTRTYYQKSLPNDPTKDYYYIMRDTGKLQTLIVEYGFLDNPNDAARLQQNWEKYAEAVVKAIANYMQHPYTAPGVGTGITYTVKSGDTLYSIAKRYGITVDELKRINNLTSNTLSIGQILKIKGQEEPEGNIFYTVVKGDTLYSMAKKFNTTVDDIKKKNNLTNNTLSVGQQLIIAGEEVSPVIPPSGNVHIVKLGDTLYSIARKYNVTVDYLKRINNLTSDILSISQKLLISSEDGSSDVNIYTVQKGDSLYSIANKYNTTVDKIKTQNNLTSNDLYIGQQLNIPKGVIDEIISNDLTYTVKSGDTLYSIAKNHNTTVDNLKIANNLTSNILSVGQILTIPNNRSKNEIIYSVKSGDTLWTIAKNFDTTVNKIKRKNNLVSNKLSIEQQLII